MGWKPWPVRFFSGSLKQTTERTAAAVAEMERERVQAGADRARPNGKKLGRPRRELDLRAARILLERGHSQREVAEMLAVPRGTLRRRLIEADQGGSESPDSGPACGQGF